MRLFVIGATGKTGTEIIDIALARGHSVTAFARSPVNRRHERLLVVKGDPLSTDALADALPGHDAVLSALGVRPPTAFRPHTLVQAGAASVVAAMTRAHVPRLALVSAAVLFPLEGPLYAFFRWLLKHIARDLRAAEDIVRATPLEWTIVRPPRLSPSANEHYRAAVDVFPEGRGVMSFRAVALFMVQAIEQHAHVRDVVGLAG